MINRIKSIYLFLIFIWGIVLKVEAQSSTLRIADSLYTYGDYSNAIQKYKEIISPDEYVLLQIAKAHKAKGTYTDALQYYKRAIHKNTISSVQLEYAKLLMVTGKFTEADSIYTKLTSNYPKNPDFQYRLGLLKKKQKDTTAISYFKEAFRLDSTHQKSCFEISKYFLKKRNYNMVWDMANKGLHTYPENVELLSILGQNFLLRKDYYSALPYFQKLLNQNQESEFIHSKLGICYSKTYEYKKAIPHFKEVLRYNNKSPNIYSLLAHAYQQEKMYKEALENYKMALALKDIPLEEDLFNIAMAYRHQEQWKKAIEYAKLALKENPNYSRAQYQLAAFADAYYKDPKTKIKYYNMYLKKFETDKKRDYFNTIIKKRVAQLEEEILKNTKGK